MALDFPSSPSLGQLYPVSPAAGQPQYRWDGSKWTTAGTTVSPPSMQIVASDTPPASPADNTLWWSTTDGLLYIYFNDGNTRQWVTVSPQQPSANVAAQIGGRLSNLAGSPIVGGNAGATSIYWNPYLGNWMPLWNGSTFIYTQCPQLQNVLANSAVGNAGPAAVAASTAYDLFIWSNAGTPTLTRGPAWANSTPGSGSRGTGAGTTELATVQGLRVNAQAIANGPAAGFGTYVGSFATDGSGTLTYQSGYTQASGGFQGNVSVWNTFNRIDVTSGTGDTTASWTYASTAYRMQNNSAGNRLNFMVGLQEDQLFAIKEQMMSATGSAVANIALGLNSTTAKYAACNTGRNGNTSGVVTGCAFNVWPAIGPNYIQALELAESGTATFYGFGGSGFWQDLTMMRWRA